MYNYKKINRMRDFHVVIRTISHSVTTISFVKRLMAVGHDRILFTPKEPSKVGNLGNTQKIM